MIIDERRRLLMGIQLAKHQWQFGEGHQDESDRKFNLQDILERRYMYLLNVAKKQKLHALREG